MQYADFLEIGAISTDISVIVKEKFLSKKDFL